MRLPLSWMLANVEVESTMRKSDEPRLDIRFTHVMLLVGTETRWIGADGNPCAHDAPHATQQERFSITTEWKDATDG